MSETVPPSSNRPITFGELLASDEAMQRDEMPTFSEIRDLATLAQNERREVGMLVVRTNVGGPITHDYRYHTTFRRGKEREINFIPEVPVRHEKNDPLSIFFHSHPLDKTPDNRGFALETFPSLSGDMGGNEYSLGKGRGGSINIFSVEGMTYLVGKMPIEKEYVETREKRFLRTVPKKHAVPNYWEILSGQLKGLKTDNFFRQIGEDVRFPEDILVSVFKRMDIGLQYNFIFLAWEKLINLEKDISFQEICFGKGISTLTNKLGIFIPHQPNLARSLYHHL